MFDKRIEELQNHFGCRVLEDWQSVRPEWILNRKGFGQGILNFIRVELAMHGLTLKDDQTPEYWNKHLNRARIRQQMGFDDSEADSMIVTPFTILIDAMEQHPFMFDGLTADANQQNRQLIIPREVRSLGESMGDYSIDGFEGMCHIERKSKDDAQGTFLGWGERRARFERELANLADMECCAVVIECSLQDLVQSAPSRGKKSAQENAKILFRQVLAWQQDYRVPWVFCETRRLAEMATFRILDRFWRKQQDRLKRAARPIEKNESQPSLVLF